MKILGISGSLRESASSSAVVRAAARLAPANVEFTLYEGIGMLPHFTPDLEGERLPEAVQRFYAQLQAADAVLICTPEYVHAMPGSLKNALDWTVSHGDFTGKPVAALSTSPSYMGGHLAHASLVHTLTVLGARVPDELQIIVPMVRNKINAQGELTDDATADALRAVVNALAQAAAA